MRTLASLAILPTLLLAACSPGGKLASAPVPTEGKPALWKLADADTTIWLFGTIHVLPEGFKWQSTPISDAVAHSDELVIETLIDPDPVKSSTLLLGMGAAKDLPPLVERVPAAKRPMLQDAIARSTLPPGFLDKLKTWTAALMLVGGSLMDMKLTAGSGVEPALRSTFAGAGKKVEGLETPAQQLGYFDGLPEQAQRDFLAAIIDTPQALRADYDDMLKAWAAGNEKAIAASFDDDVELSPTLRAVLVDQRNRAWAQWLKARLEKPGQVFVAVGAGHLVGKASVQADLEKLGLKVVRVQ